MCEREQLGESEQWYCSKCKKHSQAYKKLDIWTTPDVLILHLKRFQYVPGAYFVHRQKIDDLVSFPIARLDLGGFVRGPTDEAAPPVYDLFGVSEHSGGLGGGHYTAIAQNFKNKRWYAFNDSSVTEADASRAVSPQAYVLFYKRSRGSVPGAFPGVEKYWKDAKPAGT